MSTHHRLPHPSLRHRIENALEQTPDGLRVSDLAERLAANPGVERAERIGHEQLMRQLGLLLVEGRIDERGGVWTACEPYPMSVVRETRGRAA